MPPRSWASPSGSVRRCSDYRWNSDERSYCRCIWDALPKRSATSTGSHSGRSRLACARGSCACEPSWRSLMRCDELQHVAAELALGVADGKTRADALAHLSGCPECRRAVQELADVADALLLLAPEHEPSPGFELEVLDRVGLRPQTRRRRIRRWIPTASVAILAAAAATAAALVFSYQSDRQLASYYRATLANAHGQYFQTAELQAPDGRRAGELFLYQGSPSWIFVSV